MESKPTETIKMVSHALSVLDLLREKDTRLGVNEIAKSCSLNPSTTFRILKTLESDGYVFQLSDNRYILGEKLCFSTEKTNLYLALSDVAGFIMRKYTQKYNQAMNLTIRKGNECVIIQQSRTNKFVDYVPQLYSALPIYASSGGKILLSELPIRLVEQVLDSCDMQPLTPNTITDKDKFWSVLRNVAKDGYSLDFHESSPNGSCIAVPVRDREGTIIAALSFSGFIDLQDPEDLMKYIAPLQEASITITQELFACWNR